VLLGRRPAIAEMPRVKFLSPITPGARASIWLRRDREMLHFEVRCGALRVAQGVFRIGADGARLDDG